MTAHKIFLSYRRSDAPQATARLRELLAEKFGDERVFKDEDSIRAGAKYKKELKQALKDSAVLLAIIGDGWLDAKDEDGDRRLDDRDDWVRTEIELAMERDLLVIPVVIPDAEMPKKDELPLGLHPLLEYQHTELRTSQRDFETDAEWLIESIEARLAEVDPSFTTDDDTPDSDASLPNSYFDFLRKDSARIDILGLNAREAVPDGLPKIYVPAVTQAAKTEDEQMRSPDGDNVDLVLHRLGKDSILLTGDPGSGKTTFCQWVTYVTLERRIPPTAVPPPDELRETLPPQWHQRLPLWIRLRDFWSSVDLPPKKTTLTAKQFNAAIDTWLDSADSPGLPSACFRDQIAKGQMLLLIDGVDEVPEEDSQGKHLVYPRAALLDGLAHALPAWRKAGNRILVTSRPYVLKADQSASLDLPEANLSRLTRALQALFIRRWYGATDREHGNELAEGLIDEVSRRDALRDLRENPLLLTALCVKYREGKRLPQDIFQLYDSVVDRVLYNRYRGSDSERERVRWRLEAVALGMHYGYGEHAPRRAPLASVPITELDRILRDYIQRSPATEGDGDELRARRDELLERSGLLLPRAENKAEFYHQDFRDFLAAERWSRSDLSLRKALEEHATKRGWRRMLGFLFAKQIFEKGGVDGPLNDLSTIMPASPDACRAMKPAAALVIADCLEIAAGKADRSGLGERWQQRFSQLCQSSLTDVPKASDRNELFLALGKLGWDTRRGVGLNETGWPDIVWLPVPGDGEPEFYIARYLVTNAQYQSFLDDDYDNPRWWRNIEEKKTAPTPSYWPEPNAPRTDVDWYQAVAFARWLSTRAELPRDDWTVALPSDREWVASYTGTAERDFPWDGDTNNNRHANIWTTGIRRTSCVGLFPGGASRSRAEDMAGNAWEWCEDKYEELGQREIDSSGARRVLRGGSWSFTTDYLRASVRIGLNPDFPSYYVGFRVLCRPHLPTGR